jgi:hypothetical protein
MNARHSLAHRNLRGLITERDPVARNGTLRSLSNYRAWRHQMPRDLSPKFLDFTTNTPFSSGYEGSTQNRLMNGSSNYGESWRVFYLLCVI